MRQYAFADLSAYECIDQASGALKQGTFTVEASVALASGEIVCNLEHSIRQEPV